MMTGCKGCETTAGEAGCAIHSPYRAATGIIGDANDQRWAMDCLSELAFRRSMLLAVVSAIRSGLWATLPAELCEKAQAIADEWLKLEKEAQGARLGCL